MNVLAHSLGLLFGKNKEDGLWRHIKINSVERGMYRSIIMMDGEKLLVLWLL